MTQRNRNIEKDDLDGLRLFALGRISRCAGCARYHSLVAAHGGASRIRVDLPAAPELCTHRVCAPLVDRVFGRQSNSWVARLAACGL